MCQSRPETHYKFLIYGSVYENINHLTTLIMKFVQLIHRLHKLYDSETIILVERERV